MELQGSNHAVLFPVISPTAALVGLVTALAGMLWLRQRKEHFPPGPPVYFPGVGHLLMLAKNPFKQLRTLRKTYGDIFTIYLGSQPVIVLNGYDTIREALYTKGYQFSYRPHSFLMEKMAQYKGLLNTYGEEWTEQRTNVLRTIQGLTRRGGHLDRTLDVVLSSLTEAMVSQLGAGGVCESIDVSSLVKRSVCSVSFSIVYGRVLTPHQKEIIKYSDSLDELFRYFGMLALVNFVPCARLLPGDPVCYHACLGMVDSLESEVVMPEIDRHVKTLQEEIRKDDDTDCGYISALDPEPGYSPLGPDDVSESCIISGYLREMYQKRKKGLTTHTSEQQLVKVAGDMMAGSYDPVSTTLLWLLVYLTHYPDVQERCHKEIVEATRHGQLGHVREGMAYTQATIMEVQRVANVAPFPPAHCAERDEIVRGHLIPQGTTVMANIDSLMMDTHPGPDPQKFYPERFLGEGGTLVTPNWFMPYGTGYRMCVGASISRKLLLAFTESLLFNFRFSAPQKDGVQKPVDLNGELGLTYVPKPFSLCVESR